VVCSRNRRSGTVKRNDSKSVGTACTFVAACVCPPAECHASRCAEPTYSAKKNHSTAPHAHGRRQVTGTERSRPGRRRSLNGKCGAAKRPQNARRSPHARRTPVKQRVAFVQHSGRRVVGTQLVAAAQQRCVGSVCARQRCAVLLARERRNARRCSLPGSAAARRASWRFSAPAWCASAQQTHRQNRHCRTAPGAGSTKRNPRSNVQASTGVARRVAMPRKLAQAECR